MLFRFEFYGLALPRNICINMDISKPLKKNSLGGYWQILQVASGYFRGLPVSSYHVPEDCIQGEAVANEHPEAFAIGMLKILPLCSIPEEL